MDMDFRILNNIWWLNQIDKNSMKKNIYFFILFLAIIIIFILLYKAIYQSNSYIPSLSINNKINNFSANSLFSDNKIDIKDLSKLEKITIINIWASWCLPCREEHSFLLNLKSLDKLNIIGINYKDDEINAKKFIKELGNPYSKIVVDPSGVNSIELGAYGVPETLLVHNKTKTILKKYIGPLDDEKLAELKMIIKNEN